MIPGRCGACAKFERDFGEGETAYGHCAVKQRSGALSTKSAKCDAFRARPGFGDTQPKDDKPRFDPWDSSLDGVLPTATPTSRGGRGTGRRRSKEPQESAESIRLRLRREKDSQPVNLGDFDMDRSELRGLIEEALDDALSLKAVDMLHRFEGGTITVNPGVEGTQPKDIPIDVFFRKIIAMRENLRVLEQKINAHTALSDSERVGLQQYVTRCYGTLTTFNFLFRNKEDGFSTK